MEEKEEITLDLDETVKEVKQIIEDEDSLRMQLRMIEVAYIQGNGLEVESPEADKLFPIDWFEECDYKEKIAIIAEAITEQKKIVETQLYQRRVEGVKTR